MKKVLVFLSLILFFLAPLFCQTGQFKLDPRYTLKATKIKIPPVIDGLLNEDIWKDAPRATELYQFEPDKGQPVSQKTVGMILYDDNYIYAGFICYDTEPDKIMPGTGRRDGSARGVDAIYFAVDTLLDKRTAYYFRTSILGSQDDGAISDNGRVPDTKWDGIWLSAAARTPEGWTAEIAVPLTTVKHRRGNNQTWGLKFSRYIPRRFEKSFWCQPLEDDYRKVSTYGYLTGVDLQESSANLVIIPSTRSQLEQDKKTEYAGGLDVSYALTEAISGYLTVNPDFATIEADREQINLTRYELSLPEKRKFFLEGAAIYQQQMKLFYSKRISDIWAGAKIYGKLGKNEINFISAQSKKDDRNPSANHSVFFLKRDILKSSTVGFIAANKLVDGRNQGTVGLDAALYLRSDFNVYSQLALSYGKGYKNDFAFYIWPKYVLSTFQAYIRYTYLGQYFGDNVNAVGFIRDDNRSEIGALISKIFWLKKWGLERIVSNSNYNIFWGAVDKTLRSWTFSQSLDFDLQNKFSFNLRHFQEFKLYEKEFRNYRSTVGIGYNTREWESVEVSYQFGKNFDSDLTVIGLDVSKFLTKKLYLNYSLKKQLLKPDPENRSTWIHVISSTQYFNNDLFMKLFYQINSVIDKRNIQFVFVYRFQPPFGLVQLAYQKGTARFGQAGTQGHTLFLKFAYMF